MNEGQSRPLLRDGVQSKRVKIAFIAVTALFLVALVINIILGALLAQEQAKIASGPPVQAPGPDAPISPPSPVPVAPTPVAAPITAPVAPPVSPPPLINYAVRILTKVGGQGPYDHSNDFPLRAPSPWDISTNHARWFNRTFTEGTWMSLDISPDGQEIVFDFLGDLYTMGINGGAAVPLRTGVSWDVQPRYSPNGQWIVFASDQSGCDNIWILNRVNPSQVLQVSTETFHFVSNPWWLDDQSIVAVKWFTSERSIGAGELWEYNTTFKLPHNEGTQLVGRKSLSSQIGVEEPVASAMGGRYVYYSKNVADSTTWTYNKNPHQVIYSLYRIDRTTGETKIVVSGYGGAARPILSRTGKWLAFIRREVFQTSLFLLDLYSGNEYRLWQGLDFDQQESSAPAGVYPAYSFTPDDTAVIVWAKGHLHRVSTTNGSATQIPFSVDVSIQLSPTVRSAHPVDDEKINTTKVATYPSMSHDSAWLVHSTLASIYVAQQPFLNPVEILPATNETFYFTPSFSSDAQFITCTTWNDVKLGGVIVASFNPTTGILGKINALDLNKGRFANPTISPTHDTMTIIHLGGDVASGYHDSSDSGIYVHPIVKYEVGAGDFQIASGTLIGGGSRPHYSNDGQYIYVNVGGYPAVSLLRYQASNPTASPVVIATSVYATDIRLSPFGDYLSFVEFQHVYILPTSAGFPLNATALGPNGALAYQVGRIGDYMTWSPSSEKLRYSWGPTLHDVSINAVLNCGDPSNVNCTLAVASPLPLQVPYTPRLPRDATDSVFFTNVNIITMTSPTPILNGTIEVRNTRIVGVYDSASAPAIPPTATTFDVQGGWAMPGLVDAHAHWDTAWSSEFKVRNSWDLLANLAYGVTTVHNPSADTISIFQDAELIRAGKKIGPRIYSTGTIIYGGGGPLHCDIGSLEDAKEFLKAPAALGAWSVKSYNQPCRSARQQILEAARELNLNVVPEGGMAYFWNLNQIIDGHTTIEHALPIAPLYDDAVQLFAASGTAWTPTFIVNYGGQFGERYWHEHSDLWTDSRLLVYVPEDKVIPHYIRRTKSPDEDYHQFVTSQAVRKVFEAGGIVEAGAHGQMQGIGMHWEMVMFSQGNMTNYQSLQAGTINPARALGLDADIGSLDANKLADIVFYSAPNNPLDNLYVTQNVMWVMKDGVLYESPTLNTLYPWQEQRGPLPRVNPISIQDK